MLNRERKNILNLSHSEARKFFMKHKSYCTSELPPYILFDTVLNSLLENEELDFEKNNPEKEEKINHIILHNKDGKYAWRPIQLIHPALYVSLVHHITKEEHWQTICERFKCFRTNSKVKCTSIPVISPEEKRR